MPSSPALSRRSGSATPTASPTTTRIRSNNRFLNLGGDSSSSEGEDDAEILRPRGKLAARMLGVNTEPTTTVAQVAEDDDEDEDDIIALRPRKLKARRPRSATPEQEPPTTEPRSPSPEQNNSPAPQELFVSPSKPAGKANSDDEDLPSPSRLARNTKFEALVAKKRAERLAREAEEARKKAERNARDMIVDDEDPEDFTDDEGGQKLTQEGAKSRPSTRKASKKALEEMNRETQRMTRALQLAHEAKVKKKITKSTLFERFNFKPAGAAAATEPPKEKPAPVSSSRAGTPASIQQSDAERKEDDTPPSSPPEGESEKSAPVPQTILEDNSDDELPTVEEMAASAAAAAPNKLDKGKGKATAADLEVEDKAKEQQQIPRVKRNLRVKFPQFPVQANTAAVSLDDEDDDLQIQMPSKIDQILSRVNPNQNKEPKALLNLRRLAQLDDPDKKAGPVPTKQKFQQHQKPAMTVGELQMTLMQRAKAQAKLERERHLETLRAKGIVVMTAEEREKEEQQVEDIVARVRREAEEIMAKERAEAKEEKRKKRLENGEDPLDWDDSDYDGESWVGEEEEPEIELSGSEEENEDEDEEMEDGGVLIDGAAEESADEETEEVKVPNSDDEDGLPTASSKQARRRTRKQTAVLSDEEEENDEGVVKATPNPKKIMAKSPSVRQHTSPSVPTSVLRSATKTFIPGLPVAGPAGLGLTQIFQGTMDDSQMGSAPPDSPSQPRPTFDIGAFPDSQFSQSVQEPADSIVLNSQPAAGEQEAETQGIQIQFSQSQVHGFDSFLRDETFEATQGSELIEPTQDSGFRNFTPLQRSFIEEPASTVDTLPANQSSQVADSPLVRRTGKLRRRAEVAVSENEDEDEIMEDSLETDAASSANNAFSAMKEAARKEKERKKKEAFDKKKSKAREMVEEQAEESEDEYAGLGGADGEDSDDEDAQSVKEMIDDETTDKAEDERKLAAFYADRERAADEKQVNKLFHDITTGLLRRKRAGNWDELDDEDDGGEALRRMKRRQFAKMQRALFADERISKVAENPRNQAFLKTIEDRGSDDEMDFIWAPPPAAPGLDSQNSATGGDSSNDAVTIPDSQPQEQQQQQQQSTNPRRTNPGLTNKKKPSNIGEIRESLSNLLEDGPYNSSSVIPATILDSDSEGEAPPPSSASSNKENSKPQIVDRISLKRTSSNTSSSTRLAFAGSSDRSSSFKIPPLLRRATTNSSTLSASSGSMSSTGVTTSNLQQVRAEDGGIKLKQTASKKSGVSYLARGNERLASLAEKEKRREDKKFKGAMVGERKKALGGMFGGGKFE
ncbi:MRC1-like domain-containing protein [Cercophora samala]|uniref:MRC1-like domain-containing protein n=1 Tax=Cercophora samala TaxID=330535 RepID=A0AA39ZJK0_9PEZI|nr:MRC1-like domain-containing protein [Cercophora samala]